MSIVLYADIGNTNVCWRAWGDGNWLAELSRESVVAAPTTLRAAAMAYGTSVVVAVVSAPALGQRVEEALQASGLRFIKAGRDFSVPVQSDYEDPTQIGADRLCNALAAQQKYGCPVVSGSAGTCLTTEAVNERGVVIGGAIAAGVPAAASGVGLSVPHLAEPAKQAVQARPLSLSPGRTTEQNLSLGLWLGAAATMDVLIALATSAVGKEAPAILTGGDAPFLAPLMRTPVQVVANLTLEGLRLAFERSEG
jgi:type III pantothenate kinase